MPECTVLNTKILIEEQGIQPKLNLKMAILTGI